MAFRTHVDIVSAEAQIFSGKAEQLIVPAKMGELGIYPRHAPLISELKPGLVRLFMDGKQVEEFFVYSGFVEIQPWLVTILADSVLRSEELDAAAARASQDIEAAQKKKLDFSAELQLSLSLMRAMEQIRETRKRSR